MQVVERGARGAAHPGERLDDDDVPRAVDLADGLGQNLDALGAAHRVAAGAGQAVAVFVLRQPELGDVAREGGLRDADALLEQRVAKLLLRGDAPLVENGEDGLLAAALHFICSFRR